MEEHVAHEGEMQEEQMMQAMNTPVSWLDRQVKSNIVMLLEIIKQLFQ